MRAEVILRRASGTKESIQRKDAKFAENSFEKPILSRRHVRVRESVAMRAAVTDSLPPTREGPGECCDASCRNRLSPADT